MLRDHRPIALARANPEDLRVNGGFPDMEAFDKFMGMVAIIDRTRLSKLKSAYIHVHEH